jgi:hypothetical protein
LFSKVSFDDVGELQGNFSTLRTGALAIGPSRIPFVGVPVSVLMMSRIFEGIMHQADLRMHATLRKEC